MEERTIEIREVKELLDSGKKLKIQTVGNVYAPITKYIDKGYLDTYEVTLKNGRSIKVSKHHKFFTNSGWVETGKLLLNKHSILCDDGTYNKLKAITFIGKQKIVDITVDHPEHCYYGNGMLNHNSGKSLLAAHAIAETQKKGGVGVFIDTESAVSREFISAIGVDMKKLVYVQMEAMEDVYQTVENIIEKVRESDKNRLVTIVVDSVMGASTKKELAGDYDKEGWATDKAILASKAMRKLTGLISQHKILLIFTNQLRAKLGVMFGDPWCVDPYSTKVKIRYDEDSLFYEEYHDQLNEITKTEEK